MDFECGKCSQCCQKYWITVLPEEARAQAKALNLSPQAFIERHCQLFLQIFPGANGVEALTLSRALMPKKFVRALEEKGLALPEKVLVLPQLAFKRDQGKCSLLGEDSLCIIYRQKPEQCHLFPFLSLKKKENDFKKLYPFCPALKNFEGKMDFSEREQAHLQRVKDYFKSVKEKGFTQAWPFLPLQGKLCFRDELVADLTLEDFLKAIAPFA